MLISVIILLLLILINGFFAMAEMAVVSSRKARLQEDADAGDQSAQKALQIVEEPTDFLSTVQIAISLVAVLTGAVGGASLAEPVGDYLSDVGLPASVAGPLAFALVVGGSTYLSLVIGELVPKRIALQRPETVTKLIAAFMLRLAVLTAPLVAVLTFSTKTVLRLLGMNNDTEVPPTEGEIMALIERGIHSGVFAPDEQHMVESVMRLDERNVEELMTPRTTMRWLNLEDSPARIREVICEERADFLPVARGSLDDVVGMLYAEDLIMQALGGEELDIESAVRQPLFIPEHLSATRALGKFRTNGSVAAIVINEFGGVEGLISLLDLVEAIIGEVEHDEPHAVKREDGSYLVDGLLPLFELEELFSVQTHESHAVTLAGLVLAELGHIPEEGEVFEWRGLRFEVVDMDDRRIDKLMVTPPSSA
jgi:putative hemolysin